MANDNIQGQVTQLLAEAFNSSRSRLDDDPSIEDLEKAVTVRKGFLAVIKALQSGQLQVTEVPIEQEELPLVEVTEGDANETT